MIDLLVLGFMLALGGGGGIGDVAFSAKSLYLLRKMNVRPTRELWYLRWSAGGFV